MVVYAERTTLAAMDRIDTFLRFERSNEATLGKEVHKVAESLRLQAPRALRMARTATKTYKANRTAENKASVDTALAVLEKLAKEALSATPKPSAASSGSVSLAVVPVGVACALEAVALMIGLVRKEQERLRQAGELSAEQDAAIDAELEATVAGEHWQPGRGKDDARPG